MSPELTAAKLAVAKANLQAFSDIEALMNSDAAKKLISDATDLSDQLLPGPTMDTLKSFINSSKSVLVSVKANLAAAQTELNKYSN